MPLNALPTYGRPSNIYVHQFPSCASHIAPAACSPLSKLPVSLITSLFMLPAISTDSTRPEAIATAAIAGMVPNPPVLAETAAPTRIEGNAEPASLPILLVTAGILAKSDQSSTLSSATENKVFISSPSSTIQG